MAECFFLTRLPAEVRVVIYNHLLTFDRPLKLCQVAAGSKITSILRANHQVYQEALPVFYDNNTILAARNDFCEWPDPELQTPKRDQVRHLLVKHFSQSIRCSSLSGGNNMTLPGCCSSCHPSADGFIEALLQLPRLQTVVIDYHHHQREFHYIKSTIENIGSTDIGSTDIGSTGVYSRAGCKMKCVDVAKYHLTSAVIPPALSITFTDWPLNYIWNRFSALEQLSLFGVPEEKALLEYLREHIDQALPDKLYMLHCVRHSTLWPWEFERGAEQWQALTTDIAQGRDPGASYEALTQEIHGYLSGASIEDRWMQLLLFRMQVQKLRQIRAEERAHKSGRKWQTPTTLPLMSSAAPHPLLEDTMRLLVSSNNNRQIQANPGASDS